MKFNDDSERMSLGFEAFTEQELLYIKDAVKMFKSKLPEDVDTYITVMIALDLALSEK